VTRFALDASGWPYPVAKPVYQPCDFCGSAVQVHAVSPSVCHCSAACAYVEAVGMTAEEAADLNAEYSAYRAERRAEHPDVDPKTMVAK
jgi:hypothetical protein